MCEFVWESEGHIPHTSNPTPLTPIAYLCPNYKPGYRVPGNREEESPDSTGQCTGEEPGLSKMGTDSATENYRPEYFVFGIRVKT